MKKRERESRRMFAQAAVQCIRNVDNLYQAAVNVPEDSKQERKFLDYVDTQCWYIGFIICNLGGSRAEFLQMIAHELRRKSPDKIADDKIDIAYRNAQRTPRGMDISPSYQRIKTELARLYKVTPKELTKKTQPRYKGESKEKPCTTKQTKFFDSALRKTLTRRGYLYGKKKLPRLAAE